MNTKKPRATIDQAKAAWEAHPKPTIRTVVAALDKANLTCSVATLQRWKEADWTLKGKTRNADVKKAAADVVEGVKRQDNAVLARQSRFEAFENSLEALCQELLAEDMKPKLGEREIQERHVAVILLAKAVQKRAAFLVEVCSPEKVARLLEALAATSTIVVQPTTPEQPGDGARVIDGVAREVSPTQQAIERFQQQQRQRERVPA